MLQWPHSGFHAHDSVWVAEDDRPFALRLARYRARNPVALEQLAYEAASARVTYRSDKTEGPTAGSEARRRWAELLRRIFEVDPLRCPRCGGARRIITFLTEPAAGDLPVCTLFSAGATPMQAPRLEVAEQSNEDDQRNRNSEEEQQNRAHIATSLVCVFERVFV